jgi:hypothetical protein
MASWAATPHRTNTFTPIKIGGNKFLNRLDFQWEAVELSVQNEFKTHVVVVWTSDFEW